MNTLETLKGSSTTLREWERRLDHALRNLGDRSALNRSPLARLTYIERLAAEEYSGHILPRGLALHDTLQTCVEKILTEVGNEPALARACTYLELYSKGRSCKEISKKLGLSREHVARLYRKQALEIFTEEFISSTNIGR